MKKRIIFLLSILMCSVFVLCACKESLTENTKLSELRTDILMGENDKHKVVAVTGLRENPFDIDGVSQKEKVYFTILTVTPAEYSPLAEYNFEVTIDGTKISGKLERHPFNQTYSAEINKFASEPEMSVLITGGTTAGDNAQAPTGGSAITLKSVKNENFIDAEKAFSIGEKKLSEKIAAKNCGYEIFVRLIENPINMDGGYYWYVAFIFEDKTTCAVLIEPVTMEIAAVRD